MEKFSRKSTTNNLSPASKAFMCLRFPLSFLFVLLSTISFYDQSWCASMTEEESEESLLSLPYIQYVETEKAPNKVGTTIYNKDKASSGYNIYTFDDLMGNASIPLINMDGVLIHQWTTNLSNVTAKWYQATPFPDGSIFLTSKLTRIDWQRLNVNSHSMAIYDMPKQKAHHAAYCLKKGGFLGLVENRIHVPFQDLKIKIRDNSFVQLSSNGQPLKTIPLSKLLSKDPGYQERLKKAYDYLKKHNKHKNNEPLFDLFHANNIENLEWDIPGIAKKGSWLITVKHLDRIFIVDPEKETILWQWGENIISKPHHATFLKDGRILLLDNGVAQKSSRVIELDIKSKTIVWQYGQKPNQEFFTLQRGSAQRLQNGNTLIVESNQGRVFEVTLSGEIVWEWYAEFFTEGKNKGKRRIIYRMERLPYDFFKNVKFNHGKPQP
ncbi:MAG: hypothetical protein HQL21_05045 [Candidatus Omnitrophica bacterium]|nr:hypothetical protein [Candidatus Omnitrophota bacterium]